MSSTACPAPISCAAVASTPKSNARPTSAGRGPPCAATSKSRRVGSTEACLIPVDASLTTPSAATSTRPANSAPTALGTVGGSATVAIRSPEASAADRSSCASRIGATAMDSVTGPGTHQRPKRSQASARSTGCAPTPPNRSDTASAVTPRSPNIDQIARPGPVSPCAQARFAAGTSATPIAASMLAAKSRCSADKLNFTICLPVAGPAVAPR